MQSHNGSKRAKDKDVWLKVSKRIAGLYLYRPSGTYHAVVRRRGKLYREALKTTDLAFAKRKLDEMKRRLDRTRAALWSDDVRSLVGGTLRAHVARKPEHAGW